ncbi:MAG: HAD family hydrolase [Candidatus Woesearchaeota archaeon]
MKAIIIDLQGTLIENGVYPSPIKQVKYFLRVNRSFQDYVPVFEQSFMTKSYTNLDEAFRQVCTDFAIRVPDFVIEKLVGMWNKNKLLSKLFHDTIDFLKAAKAEGYTLVLVANIDVFSKDIIDKYELRQYFDEVQLSCDCGMLKSNPQFLLEPLARLGIDKSEAIMIGDSLESDIEAANRSGIRSVLIDRNDAREYTPKVANFQEFIDYLAQGAQNGSTIEEQSSD